MNIKSFTRAFTLVLFALLTATFAWAQTITGVAPSPINVGGTVTITGTGLPTSNVQVGLANNAATIYTVATISGTPSATSISFTVPTGAPTGLQRVFVFSPTTGFILSAANSLDIQAPAAFPGTLVLSGSIPSPSNGDGTLTITGAGFDATTTLTIVRQANGPIPMAVQVDADRTLVSPFQITFSLPTSIRHNDFLNGTATYDIYIQKGSDIRFVGSVTYTSLSTAPCTPTPDVTVVSTSPAFVVNSTPTNFTINVDRAPIGNESVTLDVLDSDDNPVSFGGSISWSGTTITITGLNVPATATTLELVFSANTNTPTGCTPASTPASTLFVPITVTAGAPTLTTVSPAGNVFRGQTITVNGTALNTPGLQFELLSTATGATPIPITVSGTSATTRTFVIPFTGVPNATYRVRALLGATILQTTNTFTLVNNVNPQITSLNPTNITVTSSTTSNTFSINGNGFLGTSQIQFINSSGAVVGTMTSGFTVVSNTLITTTFGNLPLFSGTVRVRVTTPVGVTTSTQTITRTSTDPKIYSFSPTSGSRPTASALGTLVTINGVNLQGNTSAYVIEFQTATPNTWVAGDNAPQANNVGGTAAFTRIPATAVTGRIRLRSSSSPTTILSTSLTNITIAGTTPATWMPAEDNLGLNGETDNVQTIGATPSVTLFPNPTTDAVSVATTGFTGTVTVALMDMNGASLETKSVNSGADAQFNLSNRQRGVYIVRISDEAGNTELRRVVKE